MANRQHLAILKQGVEAWNQWRQEKPEVQPDLREIDLSHAMFYKANLSEANLSGADLSEANLSGANLTEAILIRTNLSDATLTEADLSRATLTEADLSGADLSGADLSEANLSGQGSLYRANLYRANLYRANLSEINLYKASLEAATLSFADLSGAYLAEANLHSAHLSQATLAQAIFDATIVTATDLRGVHGLDTVKHHGPSSIGLDTIEQSHGQIPESFLRGCGVSDRLIEYIPLLTAQPIQYYSVFISYSSHDEALAERLHADLQAASVRCWFAPHDLTPGSYIVRGIDEAIRLHDKVVLLLSEASIQSHWVLHEVTTAQTREAREGRMVLYPVRLDDTVLTTAAGWAAELREARHIGDFRRWEEYQEYQKVFKRLLADLTATPTTPDR